MGDERRLSREPAQKFAEWDDLVAEHMVEIHEVNARPEGLQHAESSEEVVANDACAEVCVGAVGSDLLGERLRPVEVLCQFGPSHLGRACPCADSPWKSFNHVTNPLKARLYTKTFAAERSADPNRERLINSADLALLLSVWSQNEPSPAHLIKDERAGGSDLALTLPLRH